MNSCVLSVNRASRGTVSLRPANRRIAQSSERLASSAIPSTCCVSTSSLVSTLPTWRRSWRDSRLKPCRISSSLTPASGTSPVLCDTGVLQACCVTLACCRYGKDSKTEYWKNLEHLFIRLREVLPADCLVIWSLAMPLGSRLKGGFLPSEQEELYRNLRKDVMEANFYAAKLAAAYEFDVLDLHFRFRQRLEQRAADGIHWDEHAHRTITQLLLHHIAEAWGICLPQHRAPVPTSRGVGPRQSGPLRWNGAVENHFTSDLPESSLRYMSFRDAPGPEVQVPWEVGAQGSASRNWNYFRSDLPEPCPPSVRFRNASGPDGPPTARAFAPFSQAMDDPQFWNYSWRLVCNRRVMRRRVNRGRAQEPYKPQLGSSGSLPASILCLQGLLPPESLGHVLCEEELSLCI
ncbi:uncharacterized protein fam113 isoform X3 [Hemitrygon akajei]|uniref:uncharacterized protein fam113 isoform X3 n=1 Tax=Hemitrygon akajei TaxID=2704970 RepID=UPI003BF9EB8D